ncbi:MAG: alpha-ketoglutarate-dependent dioxygenase AlkB [Sphingomonas bacterium]|uniref:hypothetical protein n=1 Tax=Sphingomonas bacterium TaxID=1895847 RepID=UPI00262A8456|nr:hypothetical protein [Sphingomonas bacterium]MDB5710434.1 alpha-ketoglutarate-dependent dioxygenase AlkB [Sphingomonas bacterium]
MRYAAALRPLTVSPADDIAQSLLIRYDTGAGIGCHNDRPIYEHVIGISLGAPAAMHFRRQRSDHWERVRSAQK